MMIYITNFFMRKGEGEKFQLPISI